MKSAELILRQPDGNYKRILIARDPAEAGDDQQMIESLCASMSDSEFRNRMVTNLDEEMTERLEAIFSPSRDKVLAKA